MSRKLTAGLEQPHFDFANKLTSFDIAFLARSLLLHCRPYRRMVPLADESGFIGKGLPNEYVCNTCTSRCQGIVLA